MTATSAPRDVALPWLESALDVETATATLDGALRSSALPGVAWRIESAVLRRHKPGRRALVEYVVRDEHDTLHRILLKCRARDVDRRTVALHDRLTTLPARRWSTPQALGIVPEFHGWLQEWRRGTGGFDALAGADGARVAAAIGNALAGFHASAATDREHDMRDEVDVATRALARVAATEALLEPRLDWIAERLARFADTIGAASPSLLHRDFYPDQVLVDGETVVLLDLDLHAMGDAALDLGNFVAHLIEHDIRTGSTLAPLGDDFIAGYRAGSGRADPQAIDAYVTLTLARHIALSTVLPGRGHTTATLIDLCERRLAGASRCATSR